MDNTALDKWRQAYREAVEVWITVIQEEVARAFRPAVGSDPENDGAWGSKRRDVQMLHAGPVER